MIPPRSQYLMQALQGAPAPQAAPQAASPDLAAMAAMLGGPEGSPRPRMSIPARLGQAGQNLKGAPERVMANVQGLPGLFGLGQKAMR